MSRKIDEDIDPKSSIFASILQRNSSISEFESTPAMDYWSVLKEAKSPLPGKYRSGQNQFEKFKLIQQERIKIPKIQFGEKPTTQEVKDVCVLLDKAMKMREKCIPVKYPWVYTQHTVKEAKMPMPYDGSISYVRSDVKDNRTFVIRNGVMNVLDSSEKSLYPPYVTYAEHYEDFKTLRQIIKHAAAKTYCFSRLNFLELKYRLYKEMYTNEEVSEMKEVPHRDFYNVRKVDNHIHLSSSMNQKHLLRFIKRKIRGSGDTVVSIDKDGNKKTLKQTCKDLKLEVYDLSVDSLDVHAGKDEFHRFDRFNMKFSPFGTSELRNIFLKTNNYQKGKFFAELCASVFREMENAKYQLAEVRVSVYGRNKNELKDLAHWVFDNSLHSENVRWIIQIPRLFDLNCKLGTVKTFEEMMENIFEPFFQYSKDPDLDPVVSTFLEKYLVAFDSVDDESKIEPVFYSTIETPSEWGVKRKDNPCYHYWMYYLYSNLCVLNQYRKSKGMSQFEFRPHSGESGSVSHLISAFLLADGINHGINLRNTPVLNYLYYLTNIGISVAPLSNNHLFLPYKKNPFPEFFKQGLNVSLSTDDPLMFHFTKEPLMEEYSIAQQIMSLSTADICEIARNSVMQSGWSKKCKQYYISRYYQENGIHSNNPRKTNVPTIRIQYRHETMLEEHLYIQSTLNSIAHENDKVKPMLGLREIKEIFEKLKRHNLQLFARENQLHIPVEQLKIPRKVPGDYGRKKQKVGEEIRRTNLELKETDSNIEDINERIKNLKKRKRELKKNKKTLEKILSKRREYVDDLNRTTPVLTPDAYNKCSPERLLEAEKTPKKDE